MLKPFYQGKLDTFCAIYAVLNALRLLFGIRTGKARGILNTVLLSLGARPAMFSDFLTMQTDYFALVDEMLETQQRILPLRVARPCDDSQPPSPDELWQLCDDWLAGQNEVNRGRAIVFRFFKYIQPGSGPLNRHWTTANYISGDILHLFDSSHDAEAVINIRKNSFVTRLEDIDKDHLLYIQPSSLRFLRLAI